jgi:hypothetical protein
MRTLPATPSAPAPRPPSTRAVSGSRFVLASAAAMVALVLVLVFVSPRLLAWTLRAAPPPVPVELHQGPGWTATAVARGTDPCLEVATAASGGGPLCTTERDRRPVRAVGVAPLVGADLVHGIVSPRVRGVRLELSSGPDREGDVSYADYGHPVGFFAVTVPSGATVERVLALDADGGVMAEVACAGAAACDLDA